MTSARFRRYGLRAAGGLFAALLLGSCDGTPLLFSGPEELVVDGPGSVEGTVAEPVGPVPAIRVVDADGNAVPGVQVEFRVEEGGGSIAPETAVTDAEGRARPETWVLGEVAGLNVLLAELDDLGVVRLFAQAEPGPPSELEPISPEAQEGEVGGVVLQPPAVRVEDEYGNPVSGVEVRFEPGSGSGVVRGSPVESDHEGRARVGAWVLGPEEGEQTLTARVPDGPSTTFRAFARPPGADPYRIELQFLSQATPEQREAFEEAARRWESLITGDLSPIQVTVNEGQCGPNAPAMDRVVDDLVIFITVTRIDGPGGTLGQAGPCFVRTADSIPVVGQVILDTDDLELLEREDLLDDVILHEMGHVLGIGSLWPFLDYLKNPSLPDQRGADTHFEGPFSVDAFDHIGGASYTDGGKVPVENERGEQGSRDSHWRQSVFDNELMTAFLGPGHNPLSRVTVASLRDLGYAVDLDQADVFSLEFRLRAPSEAEPLYLGDDVAPGPIRVLGEDGRVSGEVRPGG